MRISSKTREKYAKLKWKPGLKPVEGGWLERGLMEVMQTTDKWPQWKKDQARKFNEELLAEQEAYRNRMDSHQ